MDDGAFTDFIITRLTLHLRYTDEEDVKSISHSRKTHFHVESPLIGFEISWWQRTTIFGRRKKTRPFLHSLDTNIGFSRHPIIGPKNRKKKEEENSFQQTKHGKITSESGEGEETTTSIRVSINQIILKVFCPWPLLTPDFRSLRPRVSRVFLKGDGKRLNKKYRSDQSVNF